MSVPTLNILGNEIPNPCRLNNSFQDLEREMDDRGYVREVNGLGHARWIKNGVVVANFEPAWNAWRVTAPPPSPAWRDMPDERTALVWVLAMLDALALFPTA